MSDLDFYIDNLPGAEFRAELNVFLQHIKDNMPLKTDVEAAIAALQSGKLGVDDQAKDSLKLNGKSHTAYAASLHSHEADDLPAGTLTAQGILQVLDSTTSTRTDMAAAPKSVTAAYKRGDDGYKLADTANKTANAAYPKAGGNITGTYNYTPNTGIVITFDGKTVLERHTTNGGLSFGADDGVVIGAGESRALTVQNVSMSSEILHLSADDAVIVRVNLQGGWSSRKEFYFETDGGFKPANVSKTQKNLGVRPAVVGEIVEFGFDEDQVPPGYFIMNNTRVTNGMLEPAYKELRDKCLGKFITQSGNDFIVIDIPHFKQGKGSSNRNVGQFEEGVVGSHKHVSNVPLYSGGNQAALFPFGKSSYTTSQIATTAANSSAVRGYTSSTGGSKNTPDNTTILNCLYHGVGV